MDGDGEEPAHRQSLHVGGKQGATPQETPCPSRALPLIPFPRTGRPACACPLVQGNPAAHQGVR
jgi:hypothetical protein